MSSPSDGFNIAKCSNATTSTDTFNRAGFYAENLLLYSPQVQEDGVLPLPIGETHQFAPIALGDVAQVAAHVLSGKGKNGFSDKHRGQLIVLTGSSSLLVTVQLVVLIETSGPKLVSGPLLATEASEALGVNLEFENISEYV